MTKRLIGSGVACVLALVLLASTTVRGQDTTTLLSFFLQQLATGTLSFPLGTGASGKITAQSDGVWTLFNAAGTGFTRLQFGGTTSSFPSLKRNGTTLQVRLADDSGLAPLQAASLTGSAGVLLSVTAPTISSGFGTSPSIPNSNGTAAFTVNVGTGGVATTGVLGLPAATTGWNCFVSDQAATDHPTRQTATTTTTATLTASSAWGASDILQVSCFAY